MTAKFACKDIGLECDFTAEAPTKEELMPKIAEHAKVAHGMENITDDVKAKIDAAIKVEESPVEAPQTEAAPQTEEQKPEA
jgi:predicted small metal-binding protein